MPFFLLNSNLIIPYFGINFNITRSSSGSVDLIEDICYNYVKWVILCLVLTKKDFGENIRKFRRIKGLSQENLAMTIGKAPATIVRYETGEITPNAEQIYMICNELDIYEYQLFNSTKKINNTDTIVNPFNTDVLYLYYIAYYPKSKKYDKAKFKLKLTEKPDICKVDFMDHKTDYIYLSGYLQADHHIAVFVFENYK